MSGYTSLLKQYVQQGDIQKKKCNVEDVLSRETLITFYELHPF